jgi:hypothetical protein
MEENCLFNGTARGKRQEKRRGLPVKLLIFLVTVTLLQGSPGLQAQSLQFTKWAAYDNTNTLEIYFYLRNDTALVSGDNINYVPISVFKQTGNTFAICDISATSCLLTDTGRYTYLIRDDTLRFTLVSDPCVARTLTIAFDYFIQIPNGVETVNAPPSIRLLPNPSDGQFSVSLDPEIYSGIVIFSLTGETVYRTAVNARETKIDLGGMPKGVYLLQAVSDKSSLTRKLVIR